MAPPDEQVKYADLEEVVEQAEPRVAVKPEEEALTYSSITQKIHEDAIYVLSNVGVACRDRRIIDTLTATGMASYAEDMGRIILTEDLIYWALENTPKKKDGIVMPPERSIGGGGVASTIVDQDGNLQTPDLEKHIAPIMRRAQEYGAPFMFKPASGKFTTEEQVNQIRVMRKNYYGYLFMRIEDTEAVAEFRKDYEKTGGKSCTTHSIVSSMLRFNETGENVRAFFNCAEAGFPMYLTSMPMAALDGLGSVGIVTQAHAEFLSGLALAQAINPGIIVWDGAYPAMTDPLNKYQLDLGSPAHNVLGMLTARVAFDLDLPGIQSGNTITGMRESQAYNRERIEAWLAKYSPGMSADDVTPTVVEYGSDDKGYSRLVRVIGPEGTDVETAEGYRQWLKRGGWHLARHGFGYFPGLNDNSMQKDGQDREALKTMMEEAPDLRVISRPTEKLYDPNAPMEMMTLVTSDVPMNIMGTDHTLANLNNLLNLTYNDI